MRLLLWLFVASGLSLLIGLAASHIASLMPCQGEGLACNLNEAIGGYAVLIWTCLGPLIFGVILLVANNRVALFGGMALLLAPLLLFISEALSRSGPRSALSLTGICGRRSPCSRHRCSWSSRSGGS
jgi:hypothetical protein